MIRGRETVFDQSFATQERIDIILRSLHDICMKPMDINILNLYHRNLMRLKKEAQTKFSKSEHEKCNEYIDILMRLRVKWGSGINNPGTSEQRQAVSEIYTVLDSFEDWLYLTLDRHQMLMKDKASETNAANIY